MQSLSDRPAATERGDTLTVGSTIRHALALYRLLFRRSVTAAAFVYAAIALLALARHVAPRPLAVVLGVAALIATTAGPLLVQGALIEIVRNVHEGTPAEAIRTLFESSRERLWRLFGASLLYVLGVLVAAVLLVVPGLIVAARWSLLAPLVMLEGRTVRGASERSALLVKGQTGVVLVCVVLTYLVDACVPWGLFFADVGFNESTLSSFVWSSLTAPLEAHVLTVIYYRLAEPERPVIDPAVRSWKSVWDGR